MFGIGRKDKKGKQVRIEHRGKFFRLSRTGGAALRAEKKFGRINATINTSKGIRLSAKATKNVRVALQNGNFRLIGRWKSGPWGFNLSKTGVSSSYKNNMGSFNFLKPQYSSFKFAGIQVRGKRAVTFQMTYGMFKLFIWLITLVPRLLWFIIKLTIYLLVLSIKLIIFPFWLICLPGLFLIDFVVWFFSKARRQQAIEDLKTKNLKEQEDIDDGNLRVGPDWMGGKLKLDRIEENNAKIEKLHDKNL